MYFLGEEQSLAVRAFTHGWITFSTTQNYSYHRADREYRYGLHWEGKEVEEKIQYSYRILRSVLENSKEEDVGEYGLGEELSLSDFQKYSGIDFKNRTITFFNCSAPTTEGRRGRSGVHRFRVLFVAEHCEQLPSSIL